jgi:DNA-binding NtrC family response regulator
VWPRLAPIGHLAEQPSPAAHVPTDVPNRPADAEVRRTVLLVEDDPLVRGVLAEALRDAEFDTIEASSIGEAVTTLCEHPSILVLLTDVNIAGQRGGLNLARAVHRRWPSTSIIVMSGWEKLEPDEIPPGSVFIPKPSIASKLVAEVRAAADRARAQAHNAQGGN